jgi:LAS superfamily LD-carboxypeptidase LdcB
MSIQLRGLHEGLRPAAEWALAYAAAYGIRPLVTSTYRSWTEQLALRERYEAGISPYPAARPGYSAHNYGLAWDSVLPPEYRGDPAFEAWWEAVREYAGFNVPSNDTIHAELPSWSDYITP